MNTMRSKFAALVLMSEMMAPRHPIGCTEEPKEPKEIDLSKKGLKQFTIDGVTVWALNEKNAIRKCRK